MKNESIIKAINKYKYVSFDIFDTLIKRTFEEPNHVFEYMEEKYCLKNFLNSRIEAEKKARNLTSGEIKLEQIYDNLNTLKFNKNAKDLIEIEKKVELNCCYLNTDMKKIIEFCQKEKKQIIITSDMYLPIELIKKILDKNNIQYKKIYLSSEIGKTKTSGDLFEFMLNDLKIDSNEIIHIGDNFKSDFINARKKGIKSIYIKRNIKKINHYNNIKNIDEEMLKFFINNKLSKDNDYFYNNGYTIMGPLLYKFCLWLADETKTNSINEILFLSRDGYIIKKAFDKLFSKNYVTKYFYASRRALIVPSLNLYNTLEEMLNNMYLEEKVSFRALLKNLGIDINKEIEIMIKENNLNLEYEVSISELHSKDINYYLFLVNIFDKINEESKKEQKAFCKYFESCVKNKKIAIVDIGWFGNMQNAIEKNLTSTNHEKQIFGYYVGMNPYNKNQERYEMKGFLFDKNHHQENFEFERRFNSIFETMFLANHGSLKKYTLKNNKVDFEFKEYENEKNRKYIESYQNGALDFIEDMNLNKNLDINFNNIDIFKFINDFGTNPNMADATHWGNLVFENGTVNNYIAKPQKKYKYVFCPQKILKDFTKSYWKIGFLKRLIKLKLNYNKLYDFLKRIKG